MRFSESLLVGSTAMKARPGTIGSLDEGGCAIGMAGIGEGYQIAPCSDGRQLGRESNAAEVWPWMTRVVPAPCRCWIFLKFRRRAEIQKIITHLFDHHVFGKSDWTIERLAAWCRTVEPEGETLPSAEDLDQVAREDLARQQTSSAEEAAQ